jgi:cell division cycle protein 20 (cofactor of APC complex)
MGDGAHVAVGTSTGNVQIWDCVKRKSIRTMKGHEARVSSLSWNNHMCSSGGRDSKILNHDVRIAQHLQSSFTGHLQEICGLKWSLDGTELASGGNDNICNIWDSKQQTARLSLTDACAAVKALAWAPFQKNLLATGAGTADGHIRFYNTNTGALVNSIDTKSQVSSLNWSKTEKELVSTHGYSQNQLSVWKYPSLVKIADLTGHTGRILHSAQSPDGSVVCSAAADETLRFWKVWDAPQKKTKIGLSLVLCCCFLVSLLTFFCLSSAFPSRRYFFYDDEHSVNPISILFYFLLFIEQLFNFSAFESVGFSFVEPLF